MMVRYARRCGELVDELHWHRLFGGRTALESGIGRPNPWLATVTGSEKPRLEKLMAVQSLEGEGRPFDKLARLLAAGDLRRLRLMRRFHCHQFICRGVDTVNYFGS